MFKFDLVLRTDEQARNGVLEVDEAGHNVDAVLFGFVRIVDLDEDDALLVALVVDVLQFFQDVQAGRFVLVVYNINDQVTNIKVNGVEGEGLTEEDG